ncbi:MAG: secretin N-terminal domain-containing protein [Acidobacteriota bacterium]
MRARILKTILMMSLLTLALSCGSVAFHRGDYLYEHQNYDEAVANLEKALKESPRNVKYKTTLVRARLAASQWHFERGKMAAAHGDYDVAVREIQKALEYDPGNQYAKDTMNSIIQTLRDKQAKERAALPSIDQMEKKADKDLGVPRLDPASNIPIVLKFTNTPLKTILDAISKASGINILYDDRVEQNKPITVDFSKEPLATVLDYLMMQTKNFYKVIDAHTLIIVPDTRQKRDEYQDQVIRTFYLSNADAKDVFQLVRSIIQARKMAMNQDLNSITIEDTPENVAIAQRIIEDNDKSKGEVAVDVELLEVDDNKLRNLGIDLSNHTFTVGPNMNVTKDTNGNATGIGTGPPVPLNELGRTLSHGLMVFPVPNIIVNMLLTDTNSRVLAKPQVRVMEGQKASVHIGEKIPIPTSNQYLNTAGGTTNYTPITSFTYQDIGVKVELEPRVHHNKEVTIKLKADVSSIAGYVSSSSPLTPSQPILGTREISTTIRLEDGETSMLAGLIQRNDQRAISGLPGVAEIPLLRRLFSNTQDTHTTTDVVMLLTPHIVRMPNITEKDLQPLWVGTTDRPMVEGFDNPFGPSPSPAEPQPAPKASSQATQPKQDSDNGGQDQSTNENARLLVSPTNISVKPGDPVVLNLVLLGGKDLKSLHADVNFPADALQFQGADEGTFFQMGGAPTTFAAPQSGPGLVSLDAGRADSGGSSGAGLVARLKFTASKPGEVRINIGGLTATAVSGGAVSLPPVFAVVTVQQPPSQPPAAATGKGA